MKRGPFLVAVSIIALAGALPSYPISWDPRFMVEPTPSGWIQPTSGVWSHYSESQFFEATQAVRWGEYGDPFEQLEWCRQQLLERY